jgi:hypothetical protein
MVVILFLFPESIRAIRASGFAAIAAPQKIIAGQNHQALGIEVEIPAFLQRLGFH